ncbi:MAG: hypothetical protein HDR86_07980 [Bacteroides sp.]|nr:hypothetical protein [Bacteroides sp.]
MAFLRLRGALATMERQLHNSANNDNLSRYGIKKPEAAQLNTMQTLGSY